MSWSYGILVHKYETSYSLVLLKKKHTHTKFTRQYEVQQIRVQASWRANANPQRRIPVY